MQEEPNSDDEGTFQLYEQLSFSFPSLLQPLLHERDTVRFRYFVSIPLFQRWKHQCQTVIFLHYLSSKATAFSKTHTKTEDIWNE